MKLKLTFDCDLKSSEVETFKNTFESTLEILLGRILFFSEGEHFCQRICNTSFVTYFRHNQLGLNFNRLP